MTTTLRAALISDIDLTHDETTGDITATGYIDSKKAGVFASLNAAANTTVTTAGTFQQLLGTFTNNPIEGFVLDTDKLKATITKPGWFKVSWSSSVKCNAAGTTVHVGVALNDEVLVTDGPSSMGTFLKYAAEAIALPGEDVMYIDTDDTVQIQCTSDGTGDILTFNHFQVTISPLFE